MKIWGYVFVVCVLTVGLSDEVHADFIGKNRKLFSNLVDRISPGGPTPCYHCMPDINKAQRAHDTESGSEVGRDHDKNGR